MYELDGYRSGPGFFSIDRNNGDITMFASVQSDSAVSYVLKLIAYDSEYPQDTATTNFTITIARNPEAPQFDTTVYSAVVKEEETIGYSLFTLTGSDANNVRNLLMNLILLFITFSFTRNAEQLLFVRLVLGLVPRKSK